MLKRKVEKVELGHEYGLYSREEADRIVDRLTVEDIVERKDILAWGAYYMPHKFPVSFCDEFHGYLCNTREAEQQITAGPRGISKTTLDSLIKMYQALNEPGKYDHYLLVQSTSTKAAAVNSAIKVEFETNELLRRDYGDQVSDRKWTEKQFVLKNGTIFSAIGAGESARGFQYDNKRPDNITVDDIYNEDDRFNPEAILKLNHWFFSVVFRMIAVGRKTRIHIIGTVMHKADLFHVLRERENWLFKRFQSILDEYEKKVLWPEAYPYEKLVQMRLDMGVSAFNREMQNVITDDDEQLVKEAWMKFYDGGIDSLPGDETVKLLIFTVDPSVGKDAVKKNDPVASCLMMYTNLGNFYIERLWNDYLSFNSTLNHIKNVYELYRPRVVAIESNAGFDFLSQELIRTTSIGVTRIVTSKDKLTRLANQSALFENGKVFFSRKIDRKIREEAIGQTTQNMPVHDDLRDAILLGIEHVKNRPSVRVFT